MSSDNVFPPVIEVPRVCLGLSVVRCPLKNPSCVVPYLPARGNRHVSRQRTRKPLRLAKLSSSLGGLCTGQECSGSRDLSLSMWVGQLGLLGPKGGS